MSEKATSVLMFVAAVERELGRCATITEQRFIVAMRGVYGSDEIGVCAVANDLRASDATPLRSIFED